MKRFIYTAGLVMAVGISMQPLTTQAQYYGANGSVWNDPMSASADVIIQQNMERQRLKKSFQKKSSSRRGAKRQATGQTRTRRYSTSTTKRVNKRSRRAH